LLNEEIPKFSSYLHQSLVYHIIEKNYEKLEQEKKEILLSLILKNLDKCLSSNRDSEIVILVLNKLFYDMNLKHKKLVLKEVFASNFAIYFKFNPHFIYLLFSLMKRLSDPKIINITVIKNFRLNFHLFFEDVNLAKFLLMVLNDNVIEKLDREPVFRRSIYTD